MVFPGIFPLVYLLENTQPKKKKTENTLSFWGFLGFGGFWGLKKQRKHPEFFWFFVQNLKIGCFQKVFDGFSWYFPISIPS